MSFFEDKIAHRLGGANFGKTNKIYKFEMIKRAKAAAIKSVPDRSIIDMGVGEPDWPADTRVVDILNTQAYSSANRCYADNGIIEFQQAAQEYMKDVYGVNVDASDIIHGIGSKPILAMMSLCLIDPGDVLLTTNPGYPVMGTYAEYLGGRVYNLPLREENDFFPDLDDIPKDVLIKAKALYINYPNNPTGQVATEEFFRRVIDFAHKNNVAVVHDAAYGAITFDQRKPLSFLAFDGASDVGVEIHSLSKAFNMTGWRLAFIAGNERLVKAYGAIKDNTDSGQFRAIQKAGAFALKHTDITRATCDKYSRRFDLLVRALKEVGFDAKKPKGTFYCYTKSPIGARDAVFHSASEASEYLIKNASVSTVPWDDAGAYLRFSVTFEADIHEEKRIIDELERRLKELSLRFV